MKTNELKKGDVVLLANGWFATMMDNRKGNIRLAEVYGYFTEIGSVYSHDITHYLGTDNKDVLPPENQWVAIEHTPAQRKLKAQMSALFA